MRAAAASLGWAICGVLVLCTLARWTHLDVHSTLLIAASSGAPVLLAPAWVISLMALALGRQWLALAAIALVVVDLVALAPLVAGGRGLTAAQRRPDATRVRVYALNVEYDKANGPAVTRQVRAADPDIVVLSELTPWTVEGLDLAALPYSSVQVRYDDLGGGVWSRWPLADVRVLDVAGRPMIRADVLLPGGRRLHLVQVHTRSPKTASQRSQWRRQLAALRAVLRHIDGPVIMAGDFNASRTDRDFARLLGGPLGMADAADGRGLLPTWPSGKAIPPVLRLDHVLASREVGVGPVAVLSATRSDHRAVQADLAIAARP